MYVTKTKNLMLFFQYLLIASR